MQILSVYRVVDEATILMSSDTASLGIWFPAFSGNIMVYLQQSKCQRITKGCKSSDVTRSSDNYMI
jgi:hypothetical protein